MDNVNDDLSIDFATLPPSVKTIVYQGGANGYDTLRLSGGQFQWTTYTPTGHDSGILQYDNLTVIFTGLEPVDDLNSSYGLIVYGSSGADSVHIVDGPTIGGYDTIRIYDDHATPNFEEYRFANKTIADFEPLGGNDVVHLELTRTLTLSTLYVSGGDGDDTYVVHPSFAGSSHAMSVVLGDAGNTTDHDTIDFSPLSSSVTVDLENLHTANVWQRADR